MFERLKKWFKQLGEPQKIDVSVALQSDEFMEKLENLIQKIEPKNLIINVDTEELSKKLQKPIETIIESTDQLSDLILGIKAVQLKTVEVLKAIEERRLPTQKGEPAFVTQASYCGGASSGYVFELLRGTQLECVEALRDRKQQYGNPFLIQSMCFDSVNGEFAILISYIKS